MKNHSHILAVGLLMLVLSACASSAPTPTAQAVVLTDVSIQLSWVHEYSSSSFDAAVREGFFTAQGINATLVEGGFGEAGYIDPIQAVVDGTVDFGMSSGSGLITAVNNGLSVIGVATILHRSPLALMTLDQTLQRPQDFVGRSILVSDGGARDALESLLISQDISIDSVTIVSRTDFGVDPLVNGDVDGLVAWRINEGVSLEEQGLTPTFFMFSDYGVENYEFVLFTRLEMVETQPGVVQGVVNAVHSGRDSVVDSPSNAITQTLTFAPDLNAEAQLRRLEASIPLMNKPDSLKSDLGMDKAIWEFSYQLLLARELVPADFDVTRVFTNRFADASED